MLVFIVCLLFYWLCGSLVVLSSILDRSLFVYICLRSEQSLVLLDVGDCLCIYFFWIFPFDLYLWFIAFAIYCLYVHRYLILLAPIHMVWVSIILLVDRYPVGSILNLRALSGFFFSSDSVDILISF